MTAQSARGTLLIRLAGPLQSWGTQSRFTIRDTEREPSKSGVIGLLCAALGRPRAEPVDDLAALRLGVRVDHEGHLAVDYHTAGGTHRKGEVYGVATVDGKPTRTVVSRRYYLADADFLVGLEGDAALLQALGEAVAHPTRQLSLGRKAFVPGRPLQVPNGFQPGTGLREALARVPWRRHPRRQDPPEKLRLVLETDDPTTGDSRYDQPVGAAFQTRRFAARHVQTTTLALGTDVPIEEE